MVSQDNGQGVHDALLGKQAQMYSNLKKTILERLSTDKDENRLSPRDELSKKWLGNSESVDELARGIKKLLDRASLGLPAEAREMILCFHLMSALPEKISSQLKLLPRQTYHQMITKAENSG